MQIFGYADLHKPRNFNIDPTRTFADLERLDAIRTMFANDYLGSKDRHLIDRQVRHIRERNEVRDQLTNLIRGL